MTDTPAGRTAAPDPDRLLAYVADLELEVDRLRRQGRFIERNAAETLTKILRLCTAPAAGSPLPALAEIETMARQLVEVVRDLHDPPGYHPAHDQVVAVAVRPLVEQVFRWQQRLTGTRGVALRLALEADHIEWFPARLRHVLNNLFAHALAHRDPGAAEPWVSVGLRAAGAGYELRLSDNGTWVPAGEERQVLDLFYRSAPARAAGLGAGLAVVRLLVEQSGGTMTAAPGEGRGAEFVLTLPRYDLLDYLEVPDPRA